MDKPDLPLEILFENKSQDKSELPHLTTDPFNTYTSIVNYLRSDIYPLIDAGLAALSEDNGFYTLHGPEHFDEVVRYAGLLLGCERGDEVLNHLSAYELYVLLLAIRLHDAGNMYGREGHEKRVFQILKQMGKLSGSDEFEKRFIADIAEAHGGKAPDGSKDTIGQLKESVSYGSVEIRPRLLAAIVRFADEICESRPRAANTLLETSDLPKKNEVFHKYASSIKSVKVKTTEKSVEIKFAFSVNDAHRKWGKGQGGIMQEVYLIDEILDRLEKMFLERQYCTKFMRDICNIERVRADIEIFDDNYQTIKDIHILSEEEGYPVSAYRLREKYIQYSGEKLHEELLSISAGKSENNDVPQ